MGICWCMVTMRALVDDVGVVDEEEDCDGDDGDVVADVCGTGTGDHGGVGDGSGGDEYDGIYLDRGNDECQHQVVLPYHGL